VADWSSHPPTPPGRVFNLDDDTGITHTLFREFALSERAHHSRAAKWPADLRRLPESGDAIASARNHHSESRVVRPGPALCHGRVTEGLAQVFFAAPQVQALDLVERELRGLIPRPPDRPDDDLATLSGRRRAREPVISASRRGRRGDDRSERGVGFGAQFHTHVVD
jgi:hypothetical protein